MLNKKLLSSKFFFAGMLIFLAILANVKFQQLKNESAIEKEKNTLAAQADSLQKKNQELSDSLSYLNSQDYKERIARQQLNLKKEGEAVYNFSVLNNQNSSDRPEDSEDSNAKKWWDYFFNNQS